MKTIFQDHFKSREIDETFFYKIAIHEQRGISSRL